MAKILHYIFNNSKHSVCYGVNNEEKGIEVIDKPTKVEVTGNKKLYIWAVGKKNGLPQPFDISFPTKVKIGDSQLYEADDFEIKVTLNRIKKQFILSGEPGSEEVKVLVSVRDIKEEVK